MNSVRGDVPADEQTVETQDNFFDRLSSVKLATSDGKGPLIEASGKVIDHRGAPVADAVVVIRESSTWRGTAAAIERLNQPASQRPDGPLMVDDVLARTTTDDDGNYHFPAFRSPSIPERYRRAWEWHVVAASDAGMVGWEQILPNRADWNAKVTTEQTIRLRVVRELIGQLKSVAGDPVAGARVTLARLGTAQSRNHRSIHELRLDASAMQLTTTSDQSGRFRFPSVPAKLAAQVSVQHPEHQFPMFRLTNVRTRAEGRRAETSTDGPLLDSGATIRAVPNVNVRCVVRSELGQPLKRMRVRLGSLAQTVETDVDGKCSWSLMEPLLRRVARAQSGEGVLDFTATDPEGNYAQAKVFLPVDEVIAGKEVELVAERGVIVEGYVLSREHRRPIPDARVTMRSNKTINPDVIEDPIYQIHTTNRDGHYKFVAPRQTVWLSVTGDLPGFRLTDRLVQRRGERTYRQSGQRLDLSRSPTPSPEPFLIDQITPLMVRVLDPSGNPVADAVVTSTYQRAGRFPMPRELAEPTITGNDGSCALIPKSADYVRAEVRAEKIIDSVPHFGHAFIDPAATEPTTVKLSLPWTITGRVTVNGLPHANVTVELSRRTGSSGQSMMGFRSRRIASTETNQKGEYRFVVAADETYHVRVEESPIDGKRVTDGRSPKMIAPGQLRVSDIDFTLASGIIRGVVRDVDGNAIPGAAVSASSYVGNANRSQRPPRQQVSSDQQGRFELTGLAPGTLRLHIYCPRDSETQFVATFVDAGVGNEQVEVTVDPSVVSEPPTLTPIRVVPTESVPRTDSIAP